MPDMVDFFDKAGVMIYPILAASVVGLGCAIYCLLLLRRSVVVPQPLATAVMNLAPGADLTQLREQCTQQPGPFADVLLTVIATRQSSREEAEMLVEASGRRAAHTLSSAPMVLEIVAAISPLMGLLGTVFGMNTVFARIAQTGVKEIGTLSGGISEALLTTICGLVVGIPALVAAIWFQRAVDGLVLDMERHAAELMGKARAQVRH